MILTKTTQQVTWAAMVWLLAGCSGLEEGQSTPEAFGITMVEETACVGGGGRIAMGPEGAFCDGL